MPDAVVKAVTAAVQSGRLTRQRIQESVIKILAAKEKVGLDRKRFVDLEGISDIVDSPEANEKAQEIADHAVTLVRNKRRDDSAGCSGQGLLRGDDGEPDLFGGTGIQPGGPPGGAARDRSIRGTPRTRGSNWTTR